MMESNNNNKVRCIHKILKHSDKYVVFYSSWCSYSQSAMNKIQQSGSAYRFYDIDTVPGGLDAVLKALNAQPNKVGFKSAHTTRPIIFYKGQFIGGDSDLKI